MSGWRLDALRGRSELMERQRGTESEMRSTAEAMATVRGQMYWKYDLYEGATLMATYKRGVWTEHWEEKA